VLGLCKQGCRRSFKWRDQQTGVNLMNSIIATNRNYIYIEQMLIELRIMSEKQGAPVLAYLIEMAIIEAGDLADGINITSSLDNFEPEKLKRSATS